MAKDQREALEVLRFELQFLEKGGYGRSPRTPWRPQLIFEDSPTCMNYDSKENPAPCSDCLLMRFLPGDSREQRVPCRHIVLNEEGETIESLYRTGTQQELEEVYGKWLRTAIRKLELERVEARQCSANQAAGACAAICDCSTGKTAH
jgi:hypothetical protein